MSRDQLDKKPQQGWEWGYYRQVAATATDHSVFESTYRSCANCKLPQHGAPTHRSNKSLRVYWRNLWKSLSSQQNFVAATSRTKFCLIWFFATCCCDKILLQRQWFSKNSLVHTNRFVAATCRVAATYRLVCTDLKVTATAIEMALGYTNNEVFFVDLKFSMGMVLARKNW